MHVLHLGDSALAPGGIGSVIARHLARSSRVFTSSAVVSHDPAQKSIRRRTRNYAKAVLALWRARSKADILHVHLSQGGSVLREGSLLIWGILLGFETIVTIHGSRILQLPTWHRVAVGFLARRSARVHGFGDAYREALRIPPSKWRYVPNDVDCPKSLRPRVWQGSFLFLGEVGRRKGIDVLVDAWRQLPDEIAQRSQLVIAGPLASKSGTFDRFLSQTNRAEYVGQVSHADALRLLEEADCLILPSRAEAFPMAICEALAHECVVIGTAVGGAGKLLEESGQFVVGTGDISDLRRAIIEVAKDGERSRAFARRGREFARERLTSEVVTVQWEAIYSEMLYGNERSATTDA